MNSKRGNLIIVNNIVNATQLYRYVVQTFSDLSDSGGVDITRANEASSSAGVLIYWRKAALCHRPSVWIEESAIPAMAAVVAAPIRKL